MYVDNISRAEDADSVSYPASLHGVSPKSNTVALCLCLWRTPAGWTYVKYLIEVEFSESGQGLEDHCGADNRYCRVCYEEAKQVLTLPMAVLRDTQLHQPSVCDGGAGEIELTEARTRPSYLAQHLQQEACQLPRS
jgi:hypothetical protein